MELSSPVNDMTLREAVDLKLIDNETLAYFMARTFLFLKEVGVNPNNIRFR
jgi:glycyl-tRNA synthetase